MDVVYTAHCSVARKASPNLLRWLRQIFPKRNAVLFAIEAMFHPRITMAVEEDTRVAHHLPCTVAHRGPVNPEYANANGKEGLRSLRGRKLEKGTFTIPDSHQLVAAEEDENGKVKIKWNLRNEGVFYNHDDAAADDSPFPSAMKWLSISAALHAPREEKDVEVESEKPSSE